MERECHNWNYGTFSGVRIVIPNLRALIQLADLFEFSEDVSDRRHRAMVQIGYMLRGRQAKDLEAVRDMLKLVFEIKRRERPTRRR